MKGRPIDPSIHGGGREADGKGVAPDRFRQALSHWASGVCLVAVRDADDGKVYGTTVSSFGSVSADPPLVMISLGPGAQVVPFLGDGTRFAVNVLAEDQRQLATVYADSLPVGSSPFPEEGDPTIPGALVRLVCSVERIFSVDGGRIVLGLVLEAETDSAAPLLHYRREYHRLS